MVEIQIKYGEAELSYEIRYNNLWDVIRTQNEPEGLKFIEAQKKVERAIKNPINSPKLSKLVKPKSKLVITQDDHTRATPGYLILPPLLEELNQCGVENEDISIIFACGTHRPVEEKEREALVGREIFDHITCINHDCDASDLSLVGKTKWDNEIKINALAAKADHVIATGKVEYHFYAGFSGGRKSIFPGIGGRHSITRNHALMVDKRAITGNLVNNPVHEDMVEAARMINSSFIVNIVRNTKKEFVKAFSGELDAAHTEATKYYDTLYRIKAKGLADIVIVGAGAPHDINLYQGYKAIDNAVRVVRPGGVIVAALKCTEGHGHDVFYDWANKYQSFEELEQQIMTNFEMGGHKAYFFSKVQKKARIVLVSDMKPKEVKKVFLLEPSKSIDDAMDLAYTWVGRNVKVTFLPDGTLTLPTL